MTIATRVKYYSNHTTTHKNSQKHIQIVCRSTTNKLVHTLKKRNKQQTIGHKIHWFNQGVEKRTNKE